MSHANAFVILLFFFAAFEIDSIESNAAMLDVFIWFRHKIKSISLDNTT